MQKEHDGKDDVGDNVDDGRMRSGPIRSQEGTNPLTVPVSKVELLLIKSGCKDLKG